MKKKFMTVLMVIGLVLSPWLAGAQVQPTVNPNQTLILQMLRQIIFQLQQLVATRAGLPVPTLAPTFLPTPTFVPTVTPTPSSSSTPTPSPTPSSSLNPVVTEITGPTTLRVGESGTWRVTVATPSDSQLTYRVLWGDEPISTQFLTNSTPVTQNSSTFNHSYSTAGNYIVRFFIQSDNGIRCITAPCPSGGSVESSVNVNVGP